MRQHLSAKFGQLLVWESRRCHHLGQSIREQTKVLVQCFSVERHPVSPRHEPGRSAHVVEDPVQGLIAVSLCAPSEHRCGHGREAGRLRRVVYAAGHDFALDRDRGARWYLFDEKNDAIGVFVTDNRLGADGGAAGGGECTRAA